MNLLAMVALAVLVPSADTENADVWVLVTSKHVATVAAEDAESLKTGGQGILVKCKSLKINISAEGKVIECENCVLYHTSTGMSGTAPSAVFDQVQGILTLTGDDLTPVEWTIEKNENGEQKIVSQSMQINIPNGKPPVPTQDLVQLVPSPYRPEQKTLQDPFAKKENTAGLPVPSAKETDTGRLSPRMPDSLVKKMEEQVKLEQLRAQEQNLRQLLLQTQQQKAQEVDRLQQLQELQRRILQQKQKLDSFEPVQERDLIDPVQERDSLDPVQKTDIERVFTPHSAP